MKRKTEFRFKKRYGSPKININGVGEVNSQNLNEPLKLDAMLSRTFFAVMLEEVAIEKEIETKVEAEAEIETKTDEPEEITFEGIPYDKQLAKAGFDTIEKVRNASDEELIAVKGVAEASLKKIREYLK